MSFKNLYSNKDAVKSSPKTEDIKLHQMSMSEYESLSNLEKRQFVVQQRLNATLPLIYFVMLAQTICIIAGFAWMLAKLAS
jgi:hypothetical protein